MFGKKDEQYYINKGIEYYHNGNFEEAINSYKKAIELNSNNFLPYNLIGSIYTKFEDFENAIIYYSKAIDIKPDDIMAYINRGNLYKLLKKYEDANNDLSKAIDLYNKPNVQTSSINDNRQVLESKRIIDINNKLQDLINFDNEIKTEQMILAYYYRGKNNINLKNNELAINDFDNVIKICDNNSNLKSKYIEEYKKSLIFSGILKLNHENLESALNDFNTFIDYEEKELDFVF